MDKEQSNLVQLVAAAMVDTVADVHPDPAPAGPMYGAFMAAGGSLELFQRLMDALVDAGRLSKAGAHCYVLSPAECARRGFVGRQHGTA